MMFSYSVYISLSTPLLTPSTTSWQTWVGERSRVGAQPDGIIHNINPANRDDLIAASLAFSDALVRVSNPIPAPGQATPATGLGLLIMLLLSSGINLEDFFLTFHFQVLCDGLPERETGNVPKLIEAVNGDKCGGKYGEEDET